MNTPKLRFKDKDGNKFPDWEISSIESTFSNYGGTALEAFTSLDGDYRFISIGNYQKDGNYFDNGQRIILNEKTNNKLLNKGDLVMVLNDKTQAGDIIGTTILIPEDNSFIYNQRSERLVVKDGRVHPLFAWTYLNTKKFRKLVYSISQGGTQIYVNFPAVKKLPFRVPALLEQQKIASFLSSVDKKISLLTKKYELLTTYKKGVMQKIFNQEIRFKDDAGNDYPEWKKKTLVELTLFIGSGGTPKSTTAEYYNGDIPWVSIADMTKQGKYINFTQKNITKLGIENSSARLFSKGTILYAMYASIGEVSIANVDCATSQAILGIKINPEYLNNFYLFHWLVFMKDKVVLMGQQGTQANLNLDIVKKFQVPVPSIEEQEKIALLLSALDDKISVVQNQIGLTKQYKQGLLQQMFI